MSPDEIICTTCEDEGAVVAAEGCLPEPLTDDEQARRERDEWILPWSVDTCPECGRGREVGRL